MMSDGGRERGAGTTEDGSGIVCALEHRFRGRWCMKTAALRGYSTFGTTASGAALHQHRRTLCNKDIFHKGGNEHPAKILPGDQIGELLSLSWDSQRAAHFAICCSRVTIIESRPETRSSPLTSARSMGWL